MEASFEECPSQAMAVQDTGHDDLTSPDELTCAICLGQIPPPELAMVAGCEHLYCVNCILAWAMCKETPSCPQCKHKFEHLYVHRMLDGTTTDFPVRESVCLLLRSTWFQEHLQTSEKGKALAHTWVIPDAAAEGGYRFEESYRHGGWEDEQYDEEDDEYEAIEQYYFSSAAGRARVVLGNRRFGENGYLRGGRMYARPVQQQGGGSTSAGAGPSRQGGTPVPASKAAAGGGGTGKKGPGASGGSTPAQRNGSGNTTPQPQRGVAKSGGGPSPLAGGSSAAAQGTSSMPSEPPSGAGPSEPPSEPSGAEPSEPSEVTPAAAGATPAGARSGNGKAHGRRARRAAKRAEADGYDDDGYAYDNAYDDYSF